MHAVRLVLERGARVDGCKLNSKFTSALYLAVQYGHAEVARLLLHG